MKKLLYDIIRLNPSWIYTICRDPQRLILDHKFKEARVIYEYFEKRGVVKFIINQYPKTQLDQFIPKLLVKLRIHYTSEFKIERKLETINKAINYANREYLHLPEHKYCLLTP